MPVLYTIGHSNHALADFLALLARHGVAELVDVRAAPYSRRLPHFRKAPLARSLDAHGIAYRWMGARLGGLRHRDGAASFEAVAASADFRAGLAELERLARAGTVAAMCAEGEPMACHRTILITRHLRHSGLDIRHILPDGSAEANADFESRMVQATKVADAPLLEPAAEPMEAAYAARSARMARGR